MTPAQWMLALWMLITGSINTISTKYADLECVPNYRLTDPPDTCAVPAGNGTAPVNAQACVQGCATFDHPFVQAAGMFLGELMCMTAYRISRLIKTPTEEEESDPFPPWIFAIPAFCDMAGTSIMYLGLTMTYASVFQMLRGSVVVFTGVLSVLFLGKRLLPFHWLGMLLVTLGACLVGISALEVNDDGPKPSNPILGNILIVSAQVVVAIQMVVEEKFLGRYKINALQAVGWEGFFGLIYLSCALVGMYFIPIGLDVCNGRPCVENAIHAFREIAGSPTLAVAVAGNVISIAFFNFFGISVTKAMSATHRMVLDSVRTMVIWAFSLLVAWQEFNYFQVLGFTVLLAGTFVYNEIIQIRKTETTTPKS
eukprot:CAMPEP_0184326720 /NCGR_PEP_ID=MMETSP1049-20130417/142708_1 /TAXON_ID=77928 /ORGANISM="Proteomonas sulcata, Strain CCMP704" /LENGTH=367 /DNA_ID=CAMNT_0026648925 /DNA_START=51 /DNA_END=1154 /DNA_ORIENTATION=+